MSALDVIQVRKSFHGVEAVRGVSFRVEPGEVFGLLGPNGAGKTTVMRIALHVIPADAGEVRVLGRPLDRDTRDRLGYLPEERGIYQKSTAMEVVTYAARLKGLARGEARAKAAAALERVGLADRAKSKVATLSKGMQQKVQLAATIAHGPSVLVLDEPMSGLDPVNRVLVAGIIRTEAARGAAVVLSSHEMDVVERLCDRALLIHRGQVVLEGRVREMRRRFAKNEVIVAVGGGPRETVALAEGVTPDAHLASLVQQGIKVDHFEHAFPTLEEVFVRVVGEKVELA
jgi:ABC-2 type transport system ATP-binding protein